MATPVFAQNGPAEEAAADEEIIVTGTLIRGADPVGKQAINIGEAKIEEVGAVSTMELLASVPQITNQFNRVPLSDLNIAVNQVQTSRPSIRSIGNATVATSPTLVLVNGHRIAGVGTNQSSVDPDMIPIGAISNVGIVTEGGSATYGADAVAGVINFVTHRRYDGVKVNADFGIADNYKQWSGGVIAGKTWGNGSAFFSYNYAHTDSLFGRDRDYARNLDYSSQPYRDFDLTCSSPNLAITPALVAFIGGPIIFAPFGAPTTYGAPGFALNTSNRCDNSKNGTLVPKSERHGAFVGLNQELGEKTTIDVRGFFGKRTTEARSEATGVVGLGPGNPFASGLPAGLVVGATGGSFFGFPIENRALVNFSFAPVVGVSSRRQRVNLQEWGVDTEIVHNFSESWQLKALAAYSNSHSRFNLEDDANPTRLAAAGNASTAATAINPLNIAATNRALITDLLDNELAGQVKDSLLQMRAIAEGKLFTLPGGDVRVAVGYEYMDESLRKRQGADIRIGTLGTLPYTKYKRNIHSLFGELQVPIVGEENASKGLYSLKLSAAGRYDKYSDFGSTFNPSFGLTYEPVKGFRLRGNWSSSFTAPNALDQLGGLNTVIGVAQTHPFQPAGVRPPNNSYDVIIQGAQSPLTPQTADTWSIGFDLEPTKGLRFSASYYDINFTNIISIPTPSADIFVDFPNTNAVSATGVPYARVTAFADQIPGGRAQVDPLIAGGATFYSLIDFRTGNYGVLDIAGLDFNASWTRETGFGSYDLGFNGNLQLRRNEQVSPVAALRDRLEVDQSQLSFSATAGITVGNFQGRATLYHSAGYDLTPTNSVPPQVKIGSFNTVDMFFKYDVPADAGLLKGLSFTLNIDNVFDAEPPELRRTNPGDRGFGNGFTLGRMFQIGVTKKF